jgi:hypothetical protein
VKGSLPIGLLVSEFKRVESPNVPCRRSRLDRASSQLVCRGRHTIAATIIQSPLEPSSGRSGGLLVRYPPWAIQSPRRGDTHGGFVDHQPVTSKAVITSRVSTGEFGRIATAKDCRTNPPAGLRYFSRGSGGIGYKPCCGVATTSAPVDEQIRYKNKVEKSALNIRTIYNENKVYALAIS